MGSLRKNAKLRKIRKPNIGEYLLFSRWSDADMDGSLVLRLS